MEKNMKELFTLSDGMGYGAAGIFVLISQIATGLTIIIGLFIAIVTLFIQIKRYKNMDIKK